MFDADSKAQDGIINLMSAAPRSLAVSADGNSVYAATFMSGNRTSIVHGHNLIEAELYDTPKKRPTVEQIYGTDGDSSLCPDDPKPGGGWRYGW